MVQIDVNLTQNEVLTTPEFEIPPINTEINLDEKHKDDIKEVKEHQSPEALKVDQTPHVPLVEEGTQAPAVEDGPAPLPLSIEPQSQLFNQAPSNKEIIDPGTLG